MDFLFDAYSESLPRVEAWAAERFPRPDGEPEAAHRRSIRAKALDLLRGLLPAASLSHVGIFATRPGLRAAAAAPVRLAAARGARLRRHDPGRAEDGDAELRRARGAARARRRVDLLPERALAARPTAGRAAWGSTAPRRDEPTGPAVRLLSVRGRRGRAAGGAAVRGGRHVRGGGAQRGARAAARRARRDARRAGRRARATAATGPGRGFEALRYRFEVVSDYGAFRDLQRHRMLTIQWQTLGPDLGAGVPEELEDAGVADRYREGLERSRAEHARLVEAGRPELAPYALCLGYRIRYVLDMNAREAMHLIELRSGPRGPPRLPRGRARAARRDRARAPGGGGGDDLRGPRHRAAPRADPVRDPGARQAGVAGLTAVDADGRRPRSRPRSWPRTSPGSASRSSRSWTPARA